MHKNSFNYVDFAANTYGALNPTVNVLDVGSMDVNGCYKDIFVSRGCKYTGVDVEAGNNVDVVVDDKGVWAEIERDHYDIVVCGQCFEHAEAPWELAEVIVDVCKTGGLVIIVVPWNVPVHRHPLDCWRVLPDGMVSLMSRRLGLRVIECGLNGNDTFFTGQKEAQ